MSAPRDRQNRIVTYTGMVHWSLNPYDRLKPGCGATVRGGWQRHTLGSVTCKRCIAQFGADDNPFIPVETAPPYADDHAEQRAARRRLGIVGARNIV